MTAEDTARTLMLLAEHRSSGEYVLHSAKMVGDEDDHAIWRQSRDSWRMGASAAVLTRLPEESAAFRQACQPQIESAGWRREYEAELASVRAGLDLLARFAETLEMRSLMERAKRDSASGSSEADADRHSAGHVFAMGI
jgi:hypothetical protein